MRTVSLPASAGGILWFVLALLALVGVIAAPNLGDYFVGDDFDLVGSFYSKPLPYFARLVVRNESGDAWQWWGLDSTPGHGYLRPVKIWLLALDYKLWGIKSLGYHITSTALFAGTVLAVFFILKLLMPKRPLFAFCGASMVAIHPVAEEIVPFISAREETATCLFGLLSMCAFLRHRILQGSAHGFFGLSALALLTKEYAVTFLVLPVGYDLVHWRRPSSRLLAFYLPAATLLGAYLALRWMAFGNLMGGTGGDTLVLSPLHALKYHVHFFQSLFDPTLFSLGNVRQAPVLVGLIVLALVVVALLRKPSARRMKELVFFGPIWYLASTAMLQGVYFSSRHHLLPVIGIVMFLTLLLDTVLPEGSGWQGALQAIAALTVAAVLLLPPTIETSLEYRHSAASVEEIREFIADRTAALPSGSTVLVKDVPQFVVPPYFFGWGLLSALRRPFTASDLAARSVVYNARNRMLTRSTEPVPQKFDLKIRLQNSIWVTPRIRARYLARLQREGIEGGQATARPATRVRSKSPAR